MKFVAYQENRLSSATTIVVSGSVEPALAARRHVSGRRGSFEVETRSASV